MSFKARRSRVAHAMVMESGSCGGVIRFLHTSHTQKDRTSSSGEEGDTSFVCVKGGVSASFSGKRHRDEIMVAALP